MNSKKSTGEIERERESDHEAGWIGDGGFSASQDVLALPAEIQFHNLFFVAPSEGESQATGKCENTVMVSNS